MSTKNIRVIVVLMALAIISLVTVQAVWINNIIKVSREELKRASLEAMGAIVDRLQKEESVDFLKKKIRIGGTPSDMDTAEVKMMISSHEVSYDLSSGLKKDSSFTVVNGTKMNDKDIRLKINTSADKFHSEKKVIVYAGGANSDKKEKNFDHLIKQMIVEFGNRDMPAAERINKDSLNRVIKAELMRKGLDMPFTFAVYSPGAPKPYSLLSAAFKEDMKAESLSSELFPGDFLPKKDFLLVRLENEDSYVFNKIKGMLFLTLFITLLILCVFYITIKTILKQKKLAEIKNDFINNMSHEFKTPIATISIAVDAINNPKVRESSEKLSYYSAIIKEENNKMNEHVEKVLTLALADRRQLSLGKEEVDMHALIESCLNSYELLTREKQVQLHTSLSAVIHKIKGDEFHLYGVVKNIIDNAVKYVSTIPVIRIRTYNEGDHFCISVKDNGPGMSKEALKNIFDKFYRAQTGNIHDVKGFGIGLNYVKNIVDALKGEIQVESTQGRGSEFIVKLKLA